MTVDVTSLVSDNLDVWTTAVERKSGAGRGGGKRVSLIGIDRLRSLILDLAVRGKLVAQDVADEPASTLLKKIGAERARLTKAGSIGKRRASENNADDAPYPVPEGWAWTKLADIGHDWGQKEPSGDFTYVDVSSIDQRAGVIRSPSVLAASEAPSRARKIVRVGTVIYSTVRPYLLNIAIVNQEFEPEPIASTAFAILHPFEGVSARFLYRYLRSASFISYVEDCQTGIAYPAINDKQFFSAWFPLPPLAEQQRIVAKVDELMALCDALEAESAAAKAAHQALVEALLATLTASIDAADLATNWARLEAHFDTLFTTEASVGALIQAILELAVGGRLVKSAALVRKGALEDVGDWVGGNGFPKQFQGNQTGEIPFLKVSDMNLPGNEHDITTSNNWVSSETLKLMKARAHPVGTIIFPKIGGAIATNKRRILSMPAAIDNNCAGQVPNAGINVNWLFLVLSSIDMAQYQAGTSVPALNMRRLGKHPVGIPGEEDQKAIVDKVAELMAICEALASHIGAVGETQRRFADTVGELAAA
jgi:type I restriction enzyme S subunit